MSRTTKTQKTITEEINDLRAMPVPELVDRYEELHGRRPRVKHRDWLWRRCAWKVQEQRFGGLSGAARRRLDTLIAELDLPLGDARDGRTVRGGVRPVDSGPVVGTTLARAWKGRQIGATRTTEGWEHDGVVYRSLSAVANAVTGSHLNGRLFFGLTVRPRHHECEDPGSNERTS